MHNPAPPPASLPLPVIASGHPDRGPQIDWRTHRGFDAAFARARPRLNQHALDLTGDPQAAAELVQDVEGLAYCDRLHLPPTSSFTDWCIGLLRAHFVAQHTRGRVAR